MSKVVSLSPAWDKVKNDPYLRRATILYNSSVWWHGQDVSETREVSGTEDAAIFVTLKGVVKPTFSELAQQCRFERSAACEVTNGTW